MSREQCGRPECQHVFSTTFCPNDNEGRFISDVQIEKLEVAMMQANFSLLQWMMDNCIDVVQCPKCKEITKV